MDCIALHNPYMHQIHPVIRIKMPFRRSNLRLRPINRIKHVIDAQGGVVSPTQGVVNLVAATDTPVLANTNEVETGSTVNGIYLKVEVSSNDSTALANFYIMIVKNPGGNLTFPNANAVGANDNKRYVIHQEMVMLQRLVDGNPRTVFNGVIAIPRGYRRMGPGDFLQLFMHAPGNNVDFCVQCHYKEFR